MALVTAKSSTIFIATGEETHVYRTVEEIPAALRRKLQQTTRGINAGTILIADKRGREELVRALEAQPRDVKRRLGESVLSCGSPEQTADSTPPESAARGKGLQLGDVRTWLELLLPVVIGASLWFFIESRF